MGTQYTKIPASEKINKPRPLAHERRETEKGGFMEITHGIVTKVTTTKDQCVRLTIDIDKVFADKVNLLKWQDQSVAIQCDEVDNG